MERKKKFHVLGICISLSFSIFFFLYYYREHRLGFSLEKMYSFKEYYCVLILNRSFVTLKFIILYTYLIFLTTNLSFILNRSQNKI